MARLHRVSREEWPGPHRWLAPGHNCTRLQWTVVERSSRDDGLQETGVNRGPSVDRWLRRAGVPESVIAAGKGWWCAAWAGAVYADCGLLVPAGYAACDAWMPHMIAGKGYPPAKIPPGSIVLYGVRGDAVHIGIVTRPAAPGKVMLTREGNRSYAGTTNDGVCVDQAPPRRADVLGYSPPEYFLDASGAGADVAQRARAEYQALASRLGWPKLPPAGTGAR